MDWTSVLTGHVQVQVRDLSRQIAGKLLCAQETHSGEVGEDGYVVFADGRTWMPLAVANGNSGLAVLCGYLDECFPGDGWDVFGRRELELAANSLNGSKPIGVGLHAGLSGLAFATFYLSRQGLRYTNFLNELEHQLIPLVMADASRLHGQLCGVCSSEYDVIAGLSGVGAYLLCRTEDSTAKRALEMIVQSLIELTREHKGLPRWHTPGGQVEGRLAERFSDGLLDCGMAHGMPGLLAFLALASAYGVSSEGLLDAIRTQSDWLLDHALEDAWGLNWPAAVPLDRANALSHSDVSSYFLRDKPTKTAWCYGSPGVAQSLSIAGRVLREQKYCHTAADAMRSALQKPAAKRYLGPSPTFCHGLAGLLHITTHFAVNTHEPFFEEAVTRLASEVLSRLDPSASYGFRNVDFLGIGRDDAGMLEGATGVLLSLLAAAVDVPPTWSRIFLLA